MSSMNRREFVKAGIGAAAALAGLEGYVFAGQKPGRIRPNLLFIMTDQQRWDALSLAGNKVLETPNLDRLAAEGAFFKNAFTTCPVCVPARVSMLTGYGIQTTGIRSNSDVNRKGYCQMPTFDNILAARGYWTEYYGKWHAPIWRALDYKSQVTLAGAAKTKLGPGLKAHYNQYLDKHVPTRQPGQGERLDRFSGRPYRPDPLDIGYGLAPDQEPGDKDGRRISYRQCATYGCLDIPAEYQPTAMYANETIAALERVKDRPFSITCSIHHPHAPMILPKPYYGMYPVSEMIPSASIDDPMDNSPYQHVAQRMLRYRDKDKIRYMMSNYYGLVREIDDHVGRILNKLKELGLQNNTLVIFTSDHGEMLGSHGMQEKNVFYEESVHISLILRLPGAIRAHTTITEPVLQLNLFATILDYLGAGEQKSHGRSMRRLIEGKDNTSYQHAVSEWDHTDVPNFMVRTRDFKFLFGRYEKSNTLDALYNLNDDPLEMANLIGKNPKRDQWRRQAEDMKERLITWLERTESPFLEGVKNRQVV